MSIYVSTGCNVEVTDHRPRNVQDALVDPASGRCIQAVTRIEGVGHLVCLWSCHNDLLIMTLFQIPQHMPAELSRVLLDVCDGLLTPVDTSSKL